MFEFKPSPLGLFDKLKHIVTFSPNGKIMFTNTIYGALKSYFLKKKKRKKGINKKTLFVSYILEVQRILKRRGRNPHSNCSVEKISTYVLLSNVKVDHIHYIK